jgi:Mce-associated membrane protein
MTTAANSKAASSASASAPSANGPTAGAQGESAQGESAQGEGARGAGARRPGVRGWTADPLRATALVLAILAAGFAAWSGWSWYSAARSGPPPTAQLRDEVLQAGEQAAQNFNTLDYRTVGQGLRLWEQSSTGTLHDEVTAGAAQFEKQIKQAKTITTGKILDGALISLDPQAGTATFLVAVQITVKPPQGTPTVKQNRLLGRLTRTPSGWKLSSLTQAPVGAAANGGKTP